jgi:hypothetical protein
MQEVLPTTWLLLDHSGYQWEYLLGSAVYGVISESQHIVLHTQEPRIINKPLHAMPPGQSIQIQTKAHLRTKFRLLDTVPLRLNQAAGSSSEP